MYTKIHKINIHIKLYLIPRTVIAACVECVGTLI